MNLKDAAYNAPQVKFSAEGPPRRLDSPVQPPDNEAAGLEKKTDGGMCYV